VSPVNEEGKASGRIPGTDRRTVGPVVMGPTTRQERSLAPDLARGSVLLFIALANVSFYLYGRPSEHALRPSDGSDLDRSLDFVVSFLIDQRSYPMFAILFGYGMATIARRMTARGATLGGIQRVLVRRNLWLLAFGAAHATLLFLGDILGAYGLTGLIVVLLLFSRVGIQKAWLAASLVTMTAFFALNSLPNSAPFFESSNYLIAAAVRLGLWLFTTVAIAVVIGLLAPMIIGIWLARAGLLDHPWDHVGLLRRLALGGVAANLVGGLPYALVVSGVWDVPAGAAIALGGLHALSGVAMGLAYVSLFALLAARRPRRRGAVAGLAAVGERSLTCYLLQSVMLAPLLTPWGFGVGENLGTAQAYGIAASVWLVTVVVAVLLAAAARRGPAEILLRRLTYGRRDHALPGPSPVATPT